MRRFGVVLAALAGFLTAVPGASAAPYTADDAVKIDVMGEWAHPDDDTSIIGPCGVWHERYDVQCGIIMVTRGEGGGNATGTEIGPALGLRRENEDRVAHYRSGTIDIFNVDSVDFFYNTSAPLSQFFWGTETLRRITRIIRTTQPDIYIGFTPTLNAGHGNHQMAGRYIWEGLKAAADPNMFPEQLTGPNALSTWQVKKVFSGGSTAPAPPQGTEFNSPDCTTGFVPSGVDNVVGVWTGYASPYLWPPGNLQGRPAGTPKSWAQVAAEGAAAYPTQSRTMQKGTAANGCSRFGMTHNFVPFQPNVNPDGSVNPRAGKDDAILYGATKPDPGGLPLGTLEYLTFSKFYNAPGSAVPGDAAREVGRGLDPGRDSGAQRAVGLDGRRAEGGRTGRRRRVDRDVHGDAERKRGGEPELQDLGRLVGRQRCGLHRPGGARGLARRGPLPALGQVGRVRPVAGDDRAGRTPARALERRADHRRRRDVHAAGQGPQLVGRGPERNGEPDAAVGPER